MIQLSSRSPGRGNTEGRAGRYKGPGALRAGSPPWLDMCLGVRWSELPGTGRTLPPGQQL